MDYFAKGSLVEAEDINYLHDRITALENAQVQPVLKNLQLVNMPSLLEIGQYFPVGNELVVPTTFSWELLRPELMVDESLFISVGNRKLKSGISTSVRETTIDIEQTFTFEEPASLEFSIYGNSISYESISTSFNVNWTDRVFFGTAYDKTVSREKIVQLDSKLLPSIDPIQELLLNLPASVEQYKMIALPQRFKIRRVIDNHTGFGFVFDEPIPFTYFNDYDISIPYFIYFSTYKVAPSVEMNLEIGA